MITPSFSPTATERVLPKLALDFTTGLLDNRVTFTRTTDATHPATYTNSSGYITAATNNQARFDYNPSTLACNGLLIEESRSNLLTYSNTLTYSSWSVLTATIGASAETSPDGTADAYVLTGSSGAGNYFYRTTPYLASATAYTVSAYMKKGTNSSVTLYFATAGTALGGSCAFNLANGTAGTPTNYGTTTGTTASISNAGNGWYRCAVTVTATAASYYAQITTIGTVTTHLYGFQLETGAFATSYIPTTTASLTRNADVATMTGTNFSDWYNATAGSANVSIIPKSAIGTKPLFQMDDNTADNIISLRGNVANPELYIKATTDQVQIDAGTIVVNTAYKLTGAWNTDNCAAAQNGAAVVTDASATIPTVTQARIGSDGTNYANAWLQKINYWQQRITNNEVQAFSK